jgi:RHS repeat-associated protein
VNVENPKQGGAQDDGARKRNEAHAAPSVSLPKGGGAFKSLGEKFTPNPATGAGNLSVPIPLSPGRAGFGPKLALTYDSSTGNGPFGLGWRLDVPAITRKTDKGIPRYHDAQHPDVFILSSAEDLVPALILDGGSWISDETERAGHHIVRYRPRVEGTFARIERWKRLSDGDVHWRTITRENVLTVYGAEESSRIADPDDPTRVFSWLVCRSYDDKGNAIVYEWAAENADGVDLSRASEQHRVRGANRYLKRIRYGNRTPLLIDVTETSFRDIHTPSPSIEGADWMFDAVLDYGEGHYVEDPPDEDGRVFAEATLEPPSNSPWTVRSDPFSSYRAGFEVRTYRLCRRILMFHHFPDELGVADYLVRSMWIDYLERPTGSFVTGVTLSGHRRMEDGSYLVRSLPSLELGYSTSPLDDPAYAGSDVKVASAADLDHLQVGVDENAWRWIDLDGEGIAGALIEESGGWFYRPNLGEGRFGPVRSVSSMASFVPSRGGDQRFLDMNGDGRTTVVEVGPGSPGFWKRDDDGAWGRFRTFDQWPNLDWRDRNVNLFDVTGDGLADLLISEDECLAYHPSLGEQGFGAAVRVPMPQDDERGVRIAFADATQSIFVADFSGDGLNDIVRIRNGEVCYWPNLGYGRFGAKITMDAAPRFDSPDLFDPRRIRLSDVDGSGLTDILYLGRDGVRIHLNEGGNAWSEARLLGQFPTAHADAAVTVVDLLGRGTACLVWSSRLAGDAIAPVRYLDLMEGRKPHLITRVVNNQGLEVKVDYGTSTEMYLADKAAGTPWATRLSFPVHVVKRVTTDDRISRNRFVKRYSYHHGYFDGPEREFGGFGRVDELDTEEIAAFTEEGELPAENMDPSSHVPPVLTRTWYHTGAYVAGGIISQQFEKEFHREGGAGEGALEEAQLAAMRLGESLLPSGVDAEETREACRALRGSVLRREVYGLDDTAAAGRPYTAQDFSYAVRMVQPRGANLNGVFLPIPREALAFAYERKLYTISSEERCDPRVAHTLTLDVDDYANVTRSAVVSYGRRFDDPNTLLTSADQEEQRRTHVTFAVSQMTNAVALDDAYRSPVPAETSSYELLNVAPVSTQEDVTNLFRFDELRDLVIQASDGSHDLPHEDVEGSGVSGTDAFRRLLARARTFYRRNDLDGALALGTLESLALLFSIDELAFTEGLATQTYVDSEKLTETELETILADEGKYIHSGGDSGWWTTTPRVFHSSDPGDTPAEELDYASQHFFLVLRHVSVFGETTSISYDAHDFLIQEARDPLDNRITAGERNTSGTIVAQGNDYRVLQAALLMDANRNRSAVAHDALGMVVGSAVMGKPEETLGDSLDGFDPDLTESAILAHLTDPLDDPHLLLGEATTRFIYDHFAYVRTATLDEPSPIAYSLLARETHESELGTSETTLVQHKLVYQDGLGREIQVKRQAEPGPLTPEGDDVDPRWIASGWTVFNNKGQPVRTYEPFFDDTHAFRFGNEIGVGTIQLYDPTGRPIGAVHPDHSWEKIAFDPWHQLVWDVNDTVLIEDPTLDEDIGALVARLPSEEISPTWYAQRSEGALGDDEEEAATKTEMHAATPTLSLFDSLGRPFLVVAHNKYQHSGSPVVEEYHRTRVVMDVSGRARSVVDAQDRIVVQAVHSVLGTTIYQMSMDAGPRWSLHDLVGQPIRAWDARGHVFTTEYDELRRPLQRIVRGTSSTLSDPATLAADVVFERKEYGEGETDALLYNLRGRLVRNFDGAGITATDRYDFKGLVLRTVRSIPEDYTVPPDWSGTPTLESTTFTTLVSYDALNRPLELTTPDGSVHTPSYNQAGLLDALEVNLRGASTATPFVTNVDYDAKGQRTRIERGNDVVTELEYDPLTFRLRRMTSTRPSSTNGLASQLFSDTDTVQDLRYTYDPVGNVTRLRDEALLTITHGGQEIEPTWPYTYDAIYRLIEAGGREHIGQSALFQSPAGGNYRDYPFAGWTALTDLQAIRNYTQRYEYDSVRNLVEMAHVAASGNWTRSYDYEEVSLIESSLVSNRLSGTTLSPDGASPIDEPYTHDAHGCITAMPHLSIIDWDFRSLLQRTSRQVVDGPSPEATYYVCSTNGARSRKVTLRQNGTRKNERIYLGGFELYREYAGDGTTINLERETLHVTDDRHRIAVVDTQTIVNGSPVSTPSPLQRYQLANLVDSATVELDDSAALISYEEYTPYGMTAYQGGRTAAELSLKRYRYIGRERDEETGFGNYGVRYFAPWLGRWTSPDPAGLVDGTNLYAYSRTEPIAHSDPGGEETEKQAAPHQQKRQTPQRPKIPQFPREYGGTYVKYYYVEGIQFRVGVRKTEVQKVETELTSIAKEVNRVNRLIPDEKFRVKTVIITGQARSGFRTLGGNPVITLAQHLGEANASSASHEVAHAVLDYLRSANNNVALQVSDINFRLKDTTPYRTITLDDGSTVTPTVGQMMVDPTEWSKTTKLEHPWDDQDELFASGLKAYLAEKDHAGLKASIAVAAKANKKAGKPAAQVEKPAAELMAIFKWLEDAADANEKGKKMPKAPKGSKVTNVADRQYDLDKVPTVTIESMMYEASAPQLVYAVDPDRMPRD